MAGEQAIGLDMWGHPKHIVGVLQPFSLGQALMKIAILISALYKYYYYYYDYDYYYYYY